VKILDDKVGIITGAGGGIGRGIALVAAREGARILVADYNDEGGAETVALIEQRGGEALYVKTDVTDEAQVKAAVDAAVARWGRLDFACNNAALSKGFGPLHEFERSVFEHTVEYCLTNTWLCMKHEVAAMLKNERDPQRRGTIVNISSNSALRGHAFNAPYAAVKSAVNVLTMSAAGEYGAQGIRINAVSPGVIRTPGLERHFQEQPHVEDHLKSAAVMGRLGEPEEIGEAVAFLCSDRASFITGQVLSVDGGSAVKS
jgi:NAD(P)-dependent dehydrogenase (short-subunit alcohol dehydrogenase family)